MGPGVPGGSAAIRGQAAHEGDSEPGGDRGPDDSTPPVSRSERLWSHPGLRPLSGLRDTVSSPIGAYRWEHSDRALTEQLLIEDEGYPATVEQGHAAVRYVDPTDGGDVMPTIRAQFHRLRPGVETRTVREVGSSVYQVFEGRGRALVGDRTYEVEKGDIFVVPSWAPFTLQAESRLDLFQFGDHPIIEKLNFQRIHVEGETE